MTTDVHDAPRVPENLEQGAVPFNYARFTADKQLQSALSRGRHPTAHWRLEDFHSLADGLLPDRPRGCGGIAGHVDPGRASSQRLKGTARPQHRLLNIRRPGQHGDQHVRRRGCLRRRRLPARPARCGLSFMLGPFVSRDHLITGPDQGRAHGHAHSAKPDKGDLRHGRVLPLASVQNHQKAAEFNGQRQGGEKSNETHRLLMRGFHGRMLR